MKRINLMLLSVLLFGICHISLAQTNTFPSSGNVGIGTAAPIPEFKLDVRGGASVIGSESRFSNTTFVDAAPGIAYGVKVSGGAAVVGNSIWKATGNSSYTEISSNNNGEYIRQYGTNGTTQAWLIRAYATSGVQAIFNMGGIDVHGRIKATEIMVQSPWADYVFHKDYQLPTLSEIEAYIREHQHLPGIPSEEDVKRDGVSLGEMNKKLLEKVEELTLHLIEKEKEMKQMEERMRLQDLRYTEVESMLKELIANKR